MKTSTNVLAGYAAGLLSGLILFSQLAFKEKEDGNHKTNQWFAPKLPSHMKFAGEAVPLDRWEVRERFDRELLINYYNQNNILYLLKLRTRYFPIIEKQLKANGVPEDFKYLCVAESNLQANAASRAGAIGFWQFLSVTAPGYNLEVNKEIDDRYDIVNSTNAACEYLKKAYEKFGSWTAAAASYNCGQGGYNTQATFQQTKNYYDLLLPEETNRYIFRILAFKHLMENADKLGFILDDKEVYLPFNTRNVIITKSIPDLAQFAIDKGTTYKMVKLLNPWLRSKSLTVKPGRSYTINLPADK